MTLGETDLVCVLATVQRSRPACALPDGEGPGDYRESWEIVAWLARLDPAIPTIMHTNDVPTAADVRDRTSRRSRKARFASIVNMPFDIADLERVRRENGA
jgi:hypothetical protein